MIVGIKTDSAAAELLLFEGRRQVGRKLWEPGRKLAEELMPAIESLMAQYSVGWSDLEGLVVFRGPGSFTALRVGVTVANTIAYARGLPIVGQQGEDWMHRGAQRLADGGNDRQVLPHYGAPANVTKPGRKA